jgi:hypothetical protein
MKLKKTAVKATLAGAMGAAAVGLGANIAAPNWAPPQPPPPPWAPFAPVSWNAEVQAWGVYTAEAFPPV